MKELAEVKSSVLQLHKGAEKRLEAFIQVANFLDINASFIISFIHLLEMSLSLCIGLYQRSHNLRRLSIGNGTRCLAARALKN
jgi:hypothetical protein